MPKSGAWSIDIPVEPNAYNWKGAPTVRHDRTMVRRENRPAMIDLFSGCGGFSTGLKWAGFDPILALDIHPPSLDTLAGAHKSTTTICGDIRESGLDQLRDVLGGTKVSLITAGVPCQGFSLSNRKRFSEDPRNFLFREFVRISEALRPTLVVLENVGGLLTTGQGEFRRAIAQEIEALGFKVFMKVLNAADFGVPQRRQRVFFVGVPSTARWTWPPATHGDGVAARHTTVGEAILEDLPPLLSGEEASRYLGPANSWLPKLLRGNSQVLHNHVAPTHPQETIDRIAGTRPGDPMYDGFRQRIRLHPGSQSPTQICGGIRPQFQFGHPTQPRGLTIRERARIQSFPDDYYFHGGIVQGRVQTGNAVPPLLASALGRHLCALIEGREFPESGVTDQFELIAE